MSFMEQTKANQELADVRLKTENDGSGLNAQRVQGSGSRIHRVQGTLGRGLANHETGIGGGCPPGLRTSDECDGLCAGQERPIWPSSS